MVMHWALDKSGHLSASWEVEPRPSTVVKASKIVRCDKSSIKCCSYKIVMRAYATHRRGPCET